MDNFNFDPGKILISFDDTNDFNVEDLIPKLKLSTPALFPKLVHPKVPLVLAGHTHAGQIRLPKFGAFWVPRGSDHYIAGWYKRDNTHLFVSRGLGWSVAPIRVGAPPEIAWIDIITDGAES